MRIDYSQMKFILIHDNHVIVQVDIDKVKKVTSDRNGFDSLVLPSGHKELVQALVKMHSQGPKSSATQKIDQVPQMDLVRGKGNTSNCCPKAPSSNGTIQARGSYCSYTVLRVWGKRALLVSSPYISPSAARLSGGL